MFTKQKEETKIESSRILIVFIIAILQFFIFCVTIPLFINQNSHVKFN